MTTALLDEMALECLRNCTECHNVCLQTAILPDVAGHIGSDDLKLLLNCAEICRTSADFLDTNSVFHRPVCGICSDVCTECAQMCERSSIRALRDCAPICRQCADSCRRMATS
jgi:hypothetical protein